VSGRRLAWSRLAVLLAVVLPGMQAVAACGPLSSAGDQGTPVAISGTVFVTSAGTVLEIPGAGCNQDRFTAAEAPSRVTLRLMVFHYPDCQAMQALTTGTVRLRAPLGHRALIDGLTGKPLPSVDERQFARVTYLPPGTAGPTTHFWERVYTTGGGGGIWLTQEPGNQAATLNDAPGTGYRKRSVTIRGRPGTLQYEPYSPSAPTFTVEQVVWQDGGYTFRVRAEAYYRPVILSQVLQMANGLVLQ
jgi:hypothetical protein